MTVVTGDIRPFVGYEPGTAWRVELSPVGDHGLTTTVYATDGRAIAFPFTVAVDPVTGAWSATLEPCDGDGLPDGFRWRREIVSTREDVVASTAVLNVPTSVEDVPEHTILDDPPGSIASAALTLHQQDQEAHGDPLGALATHTGSTTAHGNPLAALATHVADDEAHGDPLGALSTHQAGQGFAQHVPAAGTEGRVLMATNGAPAWAAPRLEALAHHPGVNRWRQKLAVSRMGGAGALSAITLVVGDSRVRASATLYRNAWIDRLRARFLGAVPGGYGVLPASGNLGGVTDGAWPGGDNPWTFTGAVVGSVNYGLGFHAAVVPSAGTATLTYFGDKVTLFYTRTATGPTAATVTIDGVSVGPLNARGAELPGQQAQYGTHGNYGFHTLVVTPNDGPLTLEAAQWFDGDAPFFVSGTVQMFDCSHTGFQAAMFGTSAVNNNWSAMLAGADAFFGCGIAVFDVNDIAAGRTPAQFRDDLVDIVARVDARLGTSTLSWLFPMLPASVDTTAYVQAARDAAAIIGTSRAAVVDIAALRPGRTWGADLSTDGTHPNDAGHVWLADVLGSILDPTPTTIAPVTQPRTIIDASTPAQGRSSWTEAWTGLTGGLGGYDQSGGGTTVGERRHRVWLDAGTYRATVTMQEDTGLGTVEVLIGRWVGNTPTLTSCGTKANAAGTPTLVTTRLGTSVTTAVAGWHPVVIRKTSASGAVRFVQLVIDKTA